jgi:hypothetical protein
MRKVILGREKRFPASSSAVANKAGLPDFSSYNIPKLEKMFLKGCPGWVANPGSFDFIYFLIPSLYR